MNNNSTGNSNTLIVLNANSLTIKQVVLFSKQKAKFVVNESVLERVKKSKEIIDKIVEEKIPSYGITTGVGSQKDYIVDKERMVEFQQQLLTAHSSVMSNSYVSDDVTRAALLIQLNLYCSGASGISPETFARLVKRLQSDNLPLSIDNCSVGASDIVTLSQMALNLFNKSVPLPNGNEFDVSKFNHLYQDNPDHHDDSNHSGGNVPNARKLKEVPEDDQPFKLSPKEGLSLMNSNCVTLGHGVIVLYEVQAFLQALDLAGAFSLEALRGNLNSINQAVYQIHNQPGQVQSANNINSLLSFSRLWSIKEEARFIQDPLSFRCITQIHGAAYSAYDWCSQIYQKEINLPVDNPLVSLETQCTYSHGNMENTLLALSMDTVRLALCKCIKTSAERLHKLHWPQFSGLPTGLSKGDSVSGVQFLNLSHLASAATSQCQFLSTPASNLYHGQLADGVEDVAGMAPLSIRSTKQLLEEGWKVLTIEIIISIWAIHCRNISNTAIGFGLRNLYNSILPLLPIGKEGEKIFDLRPIESLIRNTIYDNQ